eukprot:scaffold2161_cov244-Pinguiococcus_pyrenoidosus.AAC.14
MVLSFSPFHTPDDSCAAPMLTSSGGKYEARLSEVCGAADGGGSAVLLLLFRLFQPSLIGSLASTSFIYQG